MILYCLNLECCSLPMVEAMCIPLLSTVQVVNILSILLFFKLEIDCNRQAPIEGVEGGQEVVYKMKEEHVGIIMESTGFKIG